MTDLQSQQMHRVLMQYVDAYVIIAKTTEGEFIARYASGDTETTEQINAMAAMMVDKGGLPTPDKWMTTN
jgi:hypothetical protein